MVHESIRSKQFSPNRQRLLFALLTFSSLTGGGAALAAGSAVPTGGQFVAGAGAIAQAANGLSISQSSTHGIINWQSFSIAAGQSVNIANGAGATLNRVTGGDLSTIAGSLTATGSVYVVNQSGVVVAPGGKVVTGGSFVASSRDVSNAQFMAGGAMTLSGTSAGTVVNQGTITSADGDVILVGKSVANSGSISAAKGTAALAAGDTVLLQASGDDAVLVSAGSGDVTNSGTIAAAQVQLDAVGGNVYALATNDGGVIRATGTATKDGHVYLTGGDSVSIDGAVSAVNADGSGGTVVATATAVNIGATAKISASGSTKGGTVLLGGDRHGGTDPTVALSKTPIANAKTTTVAAGAQISADAGAAGKGGNVVVWSDDSTSFAGSISAKGGASAGDGGFVEVSGKGHLDFTGAVTTAAANGATGTLLLDPSDVTIVDNTGTYTDNTGTLPVVVNYTVPAPTTQDSRTTTGGTTTYTATGTGNTTAPGNNSSYILNTDIQTQLASNNVVITTSSSGTANGNILVAAPITWSSGSSLTLAANNYIKFANSADTISATGVGSLTLTAAAAAITNPTDSALNITAALSTTSGNINLNITNPASQRGQFNTNADGTITTTTGNINIVTTYNITTNSNITSTSGNINLVSTGTNSLMQIANLLKVQTGGTGTILLQSDSISLGSGGEPNETGQVITGTAGKVTVQPSSNSTIEIGSFGASPILSDQDLANITTGTLVVGSNGTAVNGFTGGITAGIMLADNLDSNSSLTMGGVNPTLHYQDGSAQNPLPLGTIGNLHLVSAGFVTANSADGNFGLSVKDGTGGLAVTAGSYIDLAYTGNTFVVQQSINHVGTLALQVTGNSGTAVSASDGVASTASIQFAGDASSGALTIGTVDGVGGITAATGGVRSVYLNNAGMVTQSTTAGNQITAASLDLEGNLGGTTATATYTLDNTANGIGSIAGNFNSLSLHDDIGLTTATIDTTSGLNGTGDITIVDNGNLKIANLQAVTTSGGNIKLEDQTFTNADAGAAFSPGAGKTWRVYSQDPTLDSNGTMTGHSNDGLTYSFVQYNAPNSYASPFTATLNAAATGNGFIYTVAPTVTETLSGTFNKTYDGTNSVTGNITSANYGAPTGTINGDTVTFSNPTGTNIATYASSHASASSQAITLNTAPTVGTATDRLGVTIYGYGTAITGGLSGVISAAPLTVTGTKTYDGTAGFTSGQLSVTGGITGDTVTLTAGSTGTAMLGGAQVADARPATPYAGSSINATVTVSGTNGSLASDYMVPTTGALTITPIMLTAVGSKVYDATFNANANTFTSFTGELSSDTAAGNVSLTGSGTLTGTNAPNVGSYSTTAGTFALNTLALTFTGAQAGKQNYVLAGANYTVTAAMLAVTTANGSKVYDGMATAPSADLTLAGLMGGDTQGGDINITGTGVLSNKNVGTYTNGGANSFSLGTLMLTGTASGNYTLATGTFTITPATLTISAVTDSKTYNATTTSTGMPTFTGLQTGDTLTGLTQSFNSPNVMGTNGSTLSVNAGYTLTDGNGGNNYTVVTNTAMGTITPLAVSFTGTRVYDGMTDASSSILAFGNDLDGANLTVSGTGVLASKNVGPEGLTSTAGALTGLTLGGTAAGNYTLMGATGTVTVTKANLVISAVTDTKVYDGGVSSSGTPTVTGLQTGDTISTTPLTQVFASKNVLGTNGSTLMVNDFTGVNDGNAGGNYNVTVNTAMGTITPLAVSFTGTRVYDGMTDASSSILAFGNDLDGANLTVSGTGVLANKNVGPEGLTSTAGALTGLTLGGTAAGNYTLMGATGTVTVTKANLVISAVPDSKTYNATTSSTGTPTVVGLQTGDTISTTPLTQAFNSPNVMGTNGSTLSVTNFTGVNDGNAGGNYNVTVNTAMGTITPLAVSFTGTRVYDGMTDASSSILAFGNDLDGANLTVSGTGVLASKNVGPEGLTSTAGALTGLTLGGTAAGNYTLMGATGTVTVTKANLVISAVTDSKTYNATTSSTGTPTVVGLQTGDTISTTPLTQAFNSPNVMGTNGSTLSVTNFTGVNDGNAGGNYNVTVNTAMGTITPLAVSFTGTRVYDGMTDASSSILAFGNDLDGANLTVSGTGVLASKNVGPEGLTSTAGALTGLTLGGTAAGNYTLMGATGTVTVTKANLVISAVTDTKVYDGGVSSSGTPTVTGLQTGDTISATPLTQVFASKNVLGTNGSTLMVNDFTGVNDGNAGGNYNVTVNTAMGTITPLAVSFTGTRVYDGMTDASSSILAFGNDLDGANLTVSGTGVLANKNVGPEGLTSTAGTLTGLTLGGTAAGNYTLMGATGTVTVTKANLVISAVTDTKVYDGGVSSSGTPTVTGLQTGDTISTTPLTQVFASKNVLGTNGSTLMVNDFTGVNDGNAGGNYNVTVNTAMGTITPLAVTLTGTRVYDGMTDASSSILAFGNDLDGANLTVSGTGVLASKNVGPEGLTSTAGTLTGLTLGGTASGNYTLMGATGTVTVTKANLVISAVTDTKVYDGGVSSSGTPTVTGLQTGDTISTTPLTQVFASKNVLGTNGSTLMVNDFTGVNDGNAGGNYNVTVNTAMGTITPLAVSFTGTRVYDGMTDASSAILAFGNDLDGANLTVSGTGVLASKNVGPEGLTSTAGTLTGLTLGGTAAGNYTLMGATGTVTVTKANLVISAVTDTKVYDGGVSSSGTPTVTGLQTGDTISTTPLTQVFASKNVLGTNGSTLMVNDFTGVNDGNAGGNYNVTVNTAMGTITPLAVSFTGTRVYDGMTDASSSILAFGNDLDGANLTVSGTGVLASKNVGPEGLTSTAGTLTGLTLGGTAAGNYTLMGATGTVTVTKANLVISAVTDTKVYDGGVSSSGTPTVTGLQTGDTISTTPLTQVFASKNVLGTNGSTLMVNDFTGVNDGNAGGNYNVTVNTAMGTITPLAVSFTGTRVYDGMTDANSPILSVGNKVTGDSVTVASGSGTLGTKNVGTDPLTSFGTLTLGGGDAGNYTLTGGTGAVNVTKANLVISAVTDTKVYDGGVSSLGTPTVTGLQTGDTISTTPLTQVFASKNVLGTNGSTLMVNDFTGVNDGNAGGNYNVTVNTAMGTITPLAVTLTGTRLYDGGTDGNAPILSVSDLIPGDSVTVATGTSTIASKNVGNEPITDFGTLTLGNNPNGNYTLVGATGVVTVTPLPITVTGTRVYNGTPGVDGSILTVTDKIPGDNLGVTGTGTAGSPHVGTQTITDPGTLALTGGDAGNYTVTGGGGTVVITPFAVNLTGTRVYDGGTDGNASILSVTNPFPGDTVDVASGTSTIANKNVGNEPITNFGTLVLGNNPNGDYTLIGATGTVIVTPQLLTVAAVPVAKTYDGTTTSAGTPIITSGTLHGTDTDSFTQRFNTPNAGTGLTLTPSGIVTDGNGGNNYVVTFVPITTGVINPRPVIVTGTRPFDNTPAAPGSILSITDLVPGDSVTLNGTGTLQSPAVGPEPVADFTGLTLVGGPASNYTLVGATGTVIITQTDLPSIAEIVTVPSSQTASGTGETVTFAAFEGGIVTLTPKQNGIVTGTIATIDGTDYHPDTQLACTLGNDGCVENGVAATPTK
jgi:hypothetical protein